MISSGPDPLAGFGPVAVLLPVKSFGEAKLRLAPALDAPHRAELARTMATHVVTSAAPLPTAGGWPSRRTRT